MVVLCELHTALLGLKSSLQLTNTLIGPLLPHKSRTYNIHAATPHGKHELPDILPEAGHDKCTAFQIYFQRITTASSMYRHKQVFIDAQDFYVPLTNYVTL